MVDKSVPRGIQSASSHCIHWTVARRGRRREGTAELAQGARRAIDGVCRDGVVIKVRHIGELARGVHRHRGRITPRLEGTDHAQGARGAISLIRRDGAVTAIRHIGERLSIGRETTTSRRHQPSKNRDQIRCLATLHAWIRCFRHRISPFRSEVVLKQCKVVIGKKEEREPHDLTVWFHTFFVWFHTIFVWYHTVRSCGSPDRMLPGIRLGLQK